MSKEVPKIRFVNFQDIWDNSSFEDAFDLSLSTNTLSRAKLNYTENGIKNIHYGDILINYGAIVDPNIDSIPTIIDGKIEKYKANLLMDGDLIFADAAEDYSVGKAVEIRGLETHYVVAGLHTIIARPKKTFSNYYLGYYINSDKFHDKLLRLVQGTKVSSLSKSSLKKTSIYYPAKQAEQQQIGLFFKKIDDLINVSQRELELLQETKKAFMQKLFPKDGNNIPDLRFEGFVDKWSNNKLSELYVRGGSGGTPRSTNKAYYAGNIPFLSISDISSSNGYIENTEKNITLEALKSTSAWIVPKGSISLAMYASVGKLAIINVDVATSQAFYNMVFDDNDLRDYVYQRLILANDTGEWSRLISTGTQANLNADKVKNFKISMPNNKKEIKQVSDFHMQIDHLITLHQRQLDSYKELKKGFLQKMFV